MAFSFQTSNFKLPPRFSVQFPRWLRVVSVLIVLNAAVVSWSVIQRHVFASTNPQETTEEADKATPGTEQTIASNSVGKLPPGPPLPVVREDSAVTVPDDDDPLLSEIKKQTARQFGELQLQTNLNSTGVVSQSAETTFESRTSTDLTLLQQRLQTVSSLNAAAEQLAQMASLQKRIGQTARAEASLAKVQRLMELMQDLLSE